ncbi:MAG: N-acetylmuramic acid 6-phosphate etherase [Pseudomonadota bacterium]
MKTEAISERYADLDKWATEAAVEAMWEGQLAAVAAVRSEISAIAQAADAAAERFLAGGRLIYGGAGTSGRLAVQDGVELGPTYGWPAHRLGYVIAGGMEALVKSAELAEDDSAAARADLGTIDLTRNDVVVGVAASGRTPYTLAVIDAAAEVGALTIGIANNRPSAILDAADIGICAETGAEIVAGSTRMKAGTAQKVVLNLFSTAAMIRCGRVYKGLMVDMVISNDKLRRRAETMIARLAETTPGDAAAALDAARGDIKTGVLCALGASAADAKILLTQSRGVLRDAIAQYAVKAELPSETYDRRIY